MLSTCLHHWNTSHHSPHITSFHQCRHQVTSYIDHVLSSRPSIAGCSLRHDTVFTSRVCSDFKLSRAKWTSQTISNWDPFIGLAWFGHLSSPKNGKIFFIRCIKILQNTLRKLDKIRYGSKLDTPIIISWLIRKMTHSQLVRYGRYGKRRPMLWPLAAASRPLHQQCRTSRAR
jgi:hypothetical protein